MIKILIVDDERTLLDAEALYLKRKENIDSDICTSPLDALELLELNSYDLIVSDYEMPGLNGLEFLAETHKRGHEIPFILFTGKSREEIAIAALNSGVDYYIQKGGDIGVLFTEMAHIIRKTVEKKRAEDKIRHLTRILSTIRNIREIINTERDFNVLLRSLCDLMTDEEGYNNARIVLFEKPGEIVAAEQSGFGEEFDSILEWLRKGELTGCARKALESDRIIISDKCSGGCTDCPFRDHHNRRGAMTMRLVNRGRTIGIISVTVPSDFIMDKDERFLFETLTRDLEYAISSFEIIEKYTGYEALENANIKLSRLNREIFSRILGNTDIISLNLEKIEDLIPKNRIIAGYIESADRAVGSIKDELRLSGFFELLGKPEPGWNNLDNIIEKNSILLNEHNIDFKKFDEEMLVFADPMLDSVFENLFRNTLIHGRSADFIEISFYETPERAVIVYEDNGAGIPNNMKNLIFTPGYGDENRMNLFISAEVLDLTGITICECGTYGNGVRFEIKIPLKNIILRRKPGEISGKDNFLISPDRNVAVTE
ncbi:MAG: response regulator [Methanomicrobiaceae archaeon]|nr:response regulator [Methanomicrobiaceae archaeon]